MPHVLNYDGQYFRVEVSEVAKPDAPDKPTYVSWCSDAFKELKDAPSQALSRFIAGPPLPKHADALRHAFEWIKIDWDAQRAKRTYKAGDKASGTAAVIYTVSIFKGDTSLRFDFEEFSDAKTFAKAAEKSLDITKVGITNNESPQYLTVWEKS